jgi:hypothetical protein
MAAPTRARKLSTSPLSIIDAAENRFAAGAQALGWAAQTQGRRDAPGVHVHHEGFHDLEGYDA